MIRPVSREYWACSVQQNLLDGSNPDLQHGNLADGTELVHSRSFELVRLLRLPSKELHRAYHVQHCAMPRDTASAKL